MTATAPGVTFSTGISTFTVVLEGTVIFTVGASFVFFSMGTSTGSVMESPVLLASLASAVDTEALMLVMLPLLSVTVVPVVPPEVLFVSVTVPFFLVSTVEVEPSVRFVVSVTVPVDLLVTVVVVEPSEFFLVVVVVLLEEPEE